MVVGVDVAEVGGVAVAEVGGGVAVVVVGVDVGAYNVAAIVVVDVCVVVT